LSGTQVLLNAVESGLVRLLCRVDDAELAKIPLCGPLILISNHVNFLEIPVLHSRLRPREVVGLAKAESWNNPLLGWLFDRWGAIPIRRGEGDITALRSSLDVLESGGILVVGPEGTRSRDGVLRRGHPGVVTLAVKSRAPVLPMAFHGGERFGHQARRLRRTPFHVAVGQPFHVQPKATRLTHDVRQAVADEIMYQLASLLPPVYRGFYGEPQLAAPVHLKFDSSLGRDGAH